MTSTTPRLGPPPPATVVVAEDSALLRTMMSDALAAEGHTVLGARDGSEALELVWSHEVDLVVLDREMPKVDGLQALRALRRGRRTRELPVVFVTSHDAPEEIVEALDQGAWDYLPKPVAPVELQARVRMLLRLRALQRELAERNAELRRMAYVDGLTGLANRRRMSELLDGRSGLPGLVLVDVDRFKAVNDTLGHAAGDLVLQAVAARLAAAAGADALVGRWGGEEFLAVAADGVEPGALAERLVAAVRAAPVALEAPDTPLAVTASAGAAAPGCGRALAGLLAAADAALYAAKEGGRDQVRVAPAAVAV